MDPYEQYDPMVLRQSLLHLSDELHPVGYPFQALLDWMHARLPTNTPEVILDIGCGVGRLAGALARHYPKATVWGVDYSYQMLRQAWRYWKSGSTLEVNGNARGWPCLQLQRPTIDNLQFGLATAEDLPIQSASVPLCTASFLFDRLEHPEAFLQEVYRVLVPGGQFLLATPFNFQRADLWRQYGEVSKLVAALERMGFSSQHQIDRLELTEPLDGRGNRLLWEVGVFDLRKK